MDLSCFSNLSHLLNRRLNFPGHANDPSSQYGFNKALICPFSVIIV